MNKRGSQFNASNINPVCLNCSNTTMMVPKNYQEEEDKFAELQNQITELECENDYLRNKNNEND